VVPKLRDKKGIILDFIYNSMLIVDPPGPVAGERMLQWLRLSNALEGLSGNIFYECVDPLKNLLVGLLPIYVVFPCFLGKD
jgi:hypothetical protein